MAPVFTAPVQRLVSIPTASPVTAPPAVSYNDENRPTAAPTVTTSNDKNNTPNNTSIIIIVGVGIVLVAINVAGLLYYFCVYRKKAARTVSHNKVYAEGEVPSVAVIDQTS